MYDCKVSSSKNLSEYRMEIPILDSNTGYRYTNRLINPFYVNTRIVDMKTEDSPLPKIFTTFSKR